MRVASSYKQLKRKFVYLRGLFLLILIIFHALFASAGPLIASDGGISIRVDGVIMEGDTRPLIENSRVMIPLRSVMEILGGKVLWYPEESQVIGFRGARGFDLIIGSSRAYLSDGSVKTLDAPACIVGGRTYVPLRFVSEAMGCGVWWDDEARTVSITTSQINARNEVETIARPALVRVLSDRGEAYGFFFTKDGVIITSADIADGAAWIRVKTSEGREIGARVMIVDKLAGLAKIRVDRDPGEEFPVFRYFDDYAGVQSGERIFMFGAGSDEPALLPGTVTAKILAEAGDRGIDTYDVSLMINASNRGGPVMKENGALLGISHSRGADEGAGAYVVPVENAFHMKNRF